MIVANANAHHHSVPGGFLSRGDEESPHRGANTEQLIDVAKVLLSMKIVVNT